jgi:hypothetical protein
MSTHLTHDDLVLHYYGESGGDTASVDAHLAACDDCRGAFARLQRTLAMVDAAPAQEPPAGFEARVWARLEPHLATPWWHDLVTLRMAWAPIGALAALALTAFLAGWFAREVPVREAAPAVGDAPTGDRLRTRVLLVAVGDHLERSTRVLSEVMNASDARSADFSVERARASDLVAASRLYRQTAQVTGDDVLEDTLDALERSLLEIANAPTDMTSQELAALRSQIERRGLLFRARVLTDDLRARDTSAAPQSGAARQKGPTS